MPRPWPTGPASRAPGNSAGYQEAPSPGSAWYPADSRRPWLRLAVALDQLSAGPAVEEVSEQLRDALGFVVVDPVRGVGQALDAVEVGHVVVVGLGEVGAEVAVAFPPDDQRGRLDGPER